MSYIQMGIFTLERFTHVFKFNLNQLIVVKKRYFIAQIEPYTIRNAAPTITAKTKKKTPPPHTHKINKTKEYEIERNVLCL